jgi:glycogen synthase
VAVLATNPEISLANDAERREFLRSWTRNTDALRGWFSEEEIARLEAARQAVQIERSTVAYCVYENPFAKSGGIFAVADNYAAALGANGQQVLLLSPLHRNLKTAPGDAHIRWVSRCQVLFGGEWVPVDIFEHVRNDCRWILFSADGFFEAAGGESRTDPYVYADPGALLTDSLFASAVVPEALASLELTYDVVVHAQDWEFAPVALTVKQALLNGRLQSAVVVLTSHNPYDRGLSPEDLSRITDRNSHGSGPSETVYQQMIPLTDAPLSTVSRNFARELTSDPLQTEHFASHLQSTFNRHGVIGVDNGLFGRPQPAFSDAAIRDGQNSRPDTILAEKDKRRDRMLEVLANYQDPRILGGLDGGDGRSLAELPPEIPVFLMFGRLDPGQKGFDVFARAIEALPPRRARFILTPIVGGTLEAYQKDLEQLAASRPGDVVVYPFRMEQGYLETIAGATYAVMPSLYEPFGGATEPYLQGTPVVARATGGLVQQVIDVDVDPLRGTGLLYREGSAADGTAWRTVQQAAGPAERMAVPAYGNMVAALSAALARAGSIYQLQKPTYGRLLSNLFERACAFSWKRAVREYGELYDLARRSSQ